MYMLVGSERAILIDTGASSSPDLLPLATTIETLFEDHAGNGDLDDGLELVIAHTHGHGVRRQLVQPFSDN